MFQSFYEGLRKHIEKVHVYECSYLCANEHAHLILIVTDNHFFKRDFRQHITWGVFLSPIRNKREFLDVDGNAIKHSVSRILVNNLRCPFNISFDASQLEECLTLLENLNIADDITVPCLPSYWITLSASSNTERRQLPPLCEFCLKRKMLTSWFDTYFAYHDVEERRKKDERLEAITMEHCCCGRNETA